MIANAMKAFNGCEMSMLKMLSSFLPNIRTSLPLFGSSKIKFFTEALFTLPWKSRLNCDVFLQNYGLLLVK